jgi:3D (Asp-Asp-Asp) domain-containing protein
MDERQLPIPAADTWQTRVARWATVVLCATLCSAVVGAVGVKPGGNRRPTIPLEPASALEKPFVPVEMVAVDQRGPVKPVRAAAAALPVSAISTTSELLKPAETSTADPLKLKPADVLPAPRVSPIRVMRMEVTAYCHCVKCCGPAAQGITASGKLVSYNNGLFVAADTNVLPFGTKLVIPGYAGNQPVEVIDRGGAIKGRKLDVYYSSHHVAREWGRRFVDVIVLD